MRRVEALAIAAASGFDRAAKRIDFMKLRHALIAPALMAAAMFAAAPARAQVVDMSKLKCEDFLKSGKDAIAYIVIWLDGYYTGDDDPATMDFGALAAQIEKYGAYCTRNPSKTMTDAADQILGK
jgi:acid stress chaperone HdeB